MNSQDTILRLGTTASIVNCVLPIIEVKVNLDNQLVYFGSSKPFCESTFIDFDNLTNEHENLSINFNMLDACEWVTLVWQGPSETPMLVLRTSTSIMRSVVDLLKAMLQIQHTSNELRSLDSAIMKFEAINFLPMKFDNNVLFELPPLYKPMGVSKHMQGMDKKYDSHT